MHAATAGGLLLLAWVGTEGSKRVERLRDRHSSPHHDLCSTWMFAGALLLPPVLVAVLAFAVLAVVQVRVQHYPTFKWLFNASTQVLGMTAAALTYQSLADGAPPTALSAAPAVLAAAVPALVVNIALVAGVVLLSVPGTKVHAAVGSRLEIALEAATLSLGVLVAVAVAAAPQMAASALPVVLVLGQVMLIAQLRHAASRDPKTGVANATAWHEHAERELSRAARTGAPLSVLLIDLDHFKTVNDTHGHLVGDTVLRAVADALVAEVRDYDVVADTGVARFGGEEFIILLPDTDAPAATRAAERVRARIAALELHPPGQARTTVQVTASIGVCTHPDQADTLTDLIAHADAALYAAKAAGRNRTAAATTRTEA